MRTSRCRRTEIDHAIPIPRVGRSWDDLRGAVPLYDAGRDGVFGIDQDFRA